MVQCQGFDPMQPYFPSTMIIECKKVVISRTPFDSLGCTIFNEKELVYFKKDNVHAFSV